MQCGFPISEFGAFLKTLVGFVPTTCQLFPGSSGGVPRFEDLGIRFQNPKFRKARAYTPKLWGF